MNQGGDQLRPATNRNRGRSFRSAPRSVDVELSRNGYHAPKSRPITQQDAGKDAGKVAGKDAGNKGAGMSSEETIQLDQFLKFVNAVQTGGEAKYLIQSGVVLVNGEVETRRRRKLRQDDEVELDDVAFVVNFEAAEDGDE